MTWDSKTPNAIAGDITLSQEEYDMVMEHRAMKRWVAQQRAQRLPQGSALRKLMEYDVSSLPPVTLHKPHPNNYR